MLSERLREVVSRIEQLPLDEQDRLAAMLTAELDEETRWSEGLASAHDLVLDHLLAEAKEQVARGDARDLDELL
jgi:hypothetical protein